MSIECYLDSKSGLGKPMGHFQQCTPKTGGNLGGATTDIEALSCSFPELQALLQQISTGAGKDWLNITAQGKGDSH